MNTLLPSRLLPFLAILIVGCSGGATPETDSNEGALAAPAAAESPAPIQSPEQGTPQRKALTSALHAKIDPELSGQKNVYVVNWLKSEPGTDGVTYAFMMAQVQAPGGKPVDWSKTTYAETVQEGMFDGGHLEALVKSSDGGKSWTVLEHGIGSTDVWWIGLPDGYRSAPKSIFPFTQSEAE